MWAYRLRDSGRCLAISALRQLFAPQTLMNERTRFAGLVLGLCASAGFFCTSPAHAAPAATHPFGPSKPVPGRYIVVFADKVSDSAAETAALMKGRGGKVHHVFGKALKGFAATLPDAAVQALREHPNVSFVEQDQTITLEAQENNATWGLDRIDQVTRPLNTVYQYNYSAAGVNAFIIDTGIRADHSEFTGRLLPGYNVAADASGVVNSTNTNDCNGHGTHVAGTVGGTVYGVAKGVSLIPVRVLDCAGSGTTSGVIAGIDWAAGSALRPAVANLSLGGGLSTALNAAVAGAVSKGVTMVVAAGNSNADACSYSPASEPSAITVAASDSADVRASYSNYGSCVDIFAPGSAITSAWNTGPSATNTISGTSMATPHVAGIAALALAANPSATPAAVTSFLLANASANQISSAGTGSPNLLAYSLAAGAPSEPAKQLIAVQSISGSAVKKGKSWTASATVKIRKLGTSTPFANATVSGSFSPGGNKTCITGSTGSCKLSSNSLPTTTAASVFTVTNVTGANTSYDASQNTATTLTIYQP